MDLCLGGGWPRRSSLRWSAARLRPGEPARIAADGAARAGQEQAALAARHAGHRHRGGSGDRDGGHRPRSASAGGRADGLVGLEPHHGLAGLGDDPRGRERERGGTVAAVAPISRTSGQIIYGDANWFTQILGTSSKYLDVRGWPLAQGEPFGRSEEALAAKVCLLGLTVKNQIFGESPAVGQQIRVKHLPCKVIGVLAAKGQSSFGQDQDDVVILPWSTVAHRLLGSQSDAVGQLVISARAPELIGAAQVEITDLLRQRHHLAEAAEDDFQLRNLAELQESARQQSRTLALLLGSVALISLLVGAIGIANVMLVSVTERTREIGIRLAVGARGRDVLLQFLVEAVLLAVLG